MYMPAISDARRVATYLIGSYIAVLLTDCESEDDIHYKHVLLIYLPDPHDRTTHPQVVLAVTAERPITLDESSDDEAETGYFLGIFPGAGHINLGISVDWGDIDKFTEKALTVAREYLTIPQTPYRVRDNSEPHTHD
ncbi:MAG: hypothetical protein EA396_07390 [Anaerolineaceae bacterium]|nr:MAG: hypothetical protein EA396_07390 [Anaerolineaceae bacterium]